MPKPQTVKGTFLVGMKIGDQVHMDFEVREGLVSDLLSAEAEADPRNTHAFNVAQIVQQLVRVGDFEGPFTSKMIESLKKADYYRLCQALVEADRLGEDVSSGSETT